MRILPLLIIIFSFHSYFFAFFVRLWNWIKGGCNGFSYKNGFNKYSFSLNNERGTWAGATFAVSAGGLGLGIYGATKKQKKISLPAYYSDPYYEKSQSDLYGFGKNALNGIIPDYYKSLTETNSPEFNDYLNLTNADIGKSILSAGAITGRGRGGGLTSQIGKYVGQNTITSRYQDFLRALGGKQMFLKSGLDALSGVRSGATNEEDSRNNYALGAFGGQLKANSAAQSQSNSTSDMLSQILGLIGPLMANNTKTTTTNKNQSLYDSLGIKTNEDFSLTSGFGQAEANGLLS